MDRLRDSDLVRVLLLRRECDDLPALFSPIYLADLVVA